MKSKIDEIAKYHGNEQKAFVFKELGDLSKFRVYGNLVLVVTYITPSISRGGILFTPAQTEESIYQGKVGYVIRMGPLAYVDDGETKFGGLRPEIGDWVYYRPALAFMQLRYDGIDCRMFEDKVIGGDLQLPEKMW